MAHTFRVKTGRPIFDLITVLCILLIMAVLVQPILSRTRLTPGCQCQGNLKQLCKALSMYLSDYDGVLPSSYLYGQSSTWNPDNFVRFAKEQGSLPLQSGMMGQSWPTILAPYYRDPGCLWCPSDRSRSGSPAARVSYYWKAAVDRAWYGTPGMMAFRKEGTFEYPGDQIILYERNSWHQGGGINGLTDGAIINCAFLDGHVGTFEIRDSGYTRRENPAEPLPASGVGEPAWFNYSFGENNARTDKGQNWDPTIWADSMREIPTGCDDPMTTCQDNLRKLATAVVMYSCDYDDDMPSSYLYRHSASWNADDFVHFASERGELTRLPSSTQRTWPMVLYPHLTSDRALWCPSDEGRSREPSARISYYWKAAVDAAWYGGPDGTGPRVVDRNNYLFPAHQIVFYERNGWHVPGQHRGLTDGTFINCAFMDGHVGMKMIRDSGYGRRESPAGPLPKSGTGEPAWYNYSFGDASPIFNKGRNWDPRTWGDNLP